MNEEMTRLLKQVATNASSSQSNVEESSLSLQKDQSFKNELSNLSSTYNTIVSQFARLQGRTPEQVDQQVKKILTNLVQISPWFDDISIETTTQTTTQKSTTPQAKSDFSTFTSLLNSLSSSMTSSNQSQTPSEALAKLTQYFQKNNQLSATVTSMLTDAKQELDAFTRSLRSIVSQYEVDLAEQTTRAMPQQPNDAFKKQNLGEPQHISTATAKMNLVDSVEKVIQQLTQQTENIITKQNLTTTIDAAKIGQKETNNSLTAKNQPSHSTQIHTESSDAHSAIAKNILILLKNPQLFEKFTTAIQPQTTEINATDDTDEIHHDQYNAAKQTTLKVATESPEFVKAATVLKQISAAIQRQTNGEEPKMGELEQQILKAIQQIKTELLETPQTPAQSTQNQSMMAGPNVKLLTETLNQLLIKNNLQTLVTTEPELPHLNQLVASSQTFLQHPIKDPEQLINWLRFMIQPLRTTESDPQAQPINELLKQLFNNVVDKKAESSIPNTLLELLKDEVSFTKKDLENLLQQMSPRHQEKSGGQENIQPIFQLPLPHDPKLQRADTFQLKRNHQSQQDLGWQFTVTTHSSQIGTIQFQANLKIPELNITIYAEKLSTVELIKSTLPMFKNRLSIFGLNLNNTLVQQRKKIDDDPVFTAHGFYTKA